MDNGAPIEGGESSLMVLHIVCTLDRASMRVFRAAAHIGGLAAFTVSPAGAEMDLHLFGEVRGRPDRPFTDGVDEYTFAIHSGDVHDRTTGEFTGYGSLAPAGLLCAQFAAEAEPHQGDPGR